MIKSSTKKIRGMTLVEVLIGASLIAIVFVAAGMLLFDQKRQEVIGNAEVEAAEIGEKFFEERAKIFATSFEDENQEVEFSGSAPAYESITIPTSGCYNGVGERFIETIENNCNGDGPPVELNADDRTRLTACNPECGDNPEQMRVNITRAPGGYNVLLPSSTQQGLIGAALCITPEGPANIVSADPANPRAGTYTAINLSLLLVVRQGGNRAKVIRKEVSFARPRMRRSDSLIPNAVGCDRRE